MRLEVAVNEYTWIGVKSSVVSIESGCRSSSRPGRRGCQLGRASSADIAPPQTKHSDWMLRPAAHDRLRCVRVPIEVVAAAAAAAGPAAGVPLVSSLG